MTLIIPAEDVPGNYREQESARKKKMLFHEEAFCPLSQHSTLEDNYINDYREAGRDMCDFRAVDRCGRRLEEQGVPSRYVAPIHSIAPITVRLAARTVPSTSPHRVMQASALPQAENDVEPRGMQQEVNTHFEGSSAKDDLTEAPCGSGKITAHASATSVGEPSEGEQEQLEPFVPVEQAGVAGLEVPSYAFEAAQSNDEDLTFLHSFKNDDSTTELSAGAGRRWSAVWRTKSTEYTEPAKPLRERIVKTAPFLLLSGIFAMFLIATTIVATGPLRKKVWSWLAALK
ncbi:uncharacterized protein LOC135399729 [Ornithodoros turicata]|uniref:uncharacterized protein LOC135399729 n=1 Tax=Ornithodoros turicata TaxID=34597 RepID=UPI00313A08BA